MSGIYGAEAGREAGKGGISERSEGSPLAESVRALPASATPKNERSTATAVLLKTGPAAGDEVNARKGLTGPPR